MTNSQMPEDDMQKKLLIIVTVTSLFLSGISGWFAYDQHNQFLELQNCFNNLYHMVQHTYFQDTVFCTGENDTEYLARHFRRGKPFKIVGNCVIR